MIVLSQFDIIIAGDDVDKKKPDPMIYNIAKSKLGVPSDRCVVIEDSIVGLTAAKQANMKCIITTTSSNSTSEEEFYQQGAAKVTDSLGEEEDESKLTLGMIFPIGDSTGKETIVESSQSNVTIEV